MMGQIGPWYYDGRTGHFPPVISILFLGNRRPALAKNGWRITLKRPPLKHLDQQNGNE